MTHLFIIGGTVGLTANKGEDEREVHVRDT